MKIIKMINLKKILPIVLICFILFLIVGAILPFVFQPKVSEEIKATVSGMEFANEEEGTERVRVLSDNGEALEERIRLISQATDRIILSTFEFRTDESGMDMLAALQAAAKRGVTVQVLVDGMAATLNMDPHFTALSAMETAEIRIYSPVSLIKPWKLMGRMHDKYLIVDDTAYILGGRNTYDYFLGDQDGYKNYDWDVLVYQNGDGCGASMNDLVKYFEGVWSLSNCKSYKDNVKELTKAKVRKAGKELENRYDLLRAEHSDWFEIVDYVSNTYSTNRISLVTNPTHCYAKEPVVFYAITELMQQAKEEVNFHTPYIIANDWMLERLKEVCDTVSQVSMMTNSVANNGNPFGAMDYDKYKGDILDTGVQILEYDGGVSYHGKCFVVDDRISGIGSFNWDMRSVYLDTEVMLIIDSEEVNANLRREMAEYEADALTVIDEDTYENGAKTQEMTTKQRVRIAVLRVIAGWARFLM